MCFSLLQFPRYRLQTLANSCWLSFHRLGKKNVEGSNSYNSSRYKFFCSKNHELEIQNRKWTGVTRRTINTNAQSNGEKPIKEVVIRHEVISETTRVESKTYKLETTKVERTRKAGVSSKIVSEGTRAELSTYKLEITEEASEEHYVQLAKLVTIICFDIETTGFSRDKDRIIEIACQDLRGGENSTFQTLVNPERQVSNEHVHGISTRMVKRPGVPRMKDLIPILTQYVRSRQIPGGLVVLVSHNARTFDVPFLKNEFTRCSYEIPSDWLFADTLPLARAVMKSKGDKVPSKTSLQALREHYGIPLIGSAHRALSDVHTLALVLQRLTYDLKLSVSGLIQGSFK